MPSITTSRLMHIPGLNLIVFQALNIEFVVEKVWFGLVSIDGLNQQTK